MFFTFLSLGASLFGMGEKKEKHFHDSIIGNWTIVGKELTEDAVNQTFELSVAKGEGNKATGVLIGEDEDGVPVPLGSFDFALEEDNQTYSFIATPQEGEASEAVKVTPITTPTGHTVFATIGKNSAVFKIVMDRFVELTLVDSETGIISKYTFSKVVEQNKVNQLQMMLPMIMMMVMQFCMKGQTCPACQGGACNVEKKEE